MEKKNRGIWTLTGIWVAELLLIGGFRISGAMLPEDISYRVWVRALMAVGERLIMPITLFVLLLCLLHRLGRSGAKVPSILGGVILSVLFSLYLLYAAVRLFFGFILLDKESELAPGILKTQEMGRSGVMEESFQEKLGSFLKKEYTDWGNIALWTVEKRYGERFCVESVTEKSCRLYALETPTLQFHVQIGQADPEHEAVQDNYPVMRAAYLMRQADTLYALQREVLAEYDAENIHIRCESREDMEDCAKDIEIMLSEALQDSLLLEQGRQQELVVDCGNGAESFQVVLSFGGSGKRAAYYTDQTVVYRELLYGFDAAEPQEEEAGEQDELSPYYPEGAYRKLYEAIYEKQGYPYEYGYNAKGNFYAFLCEGTEVPETAEEEMSYRETVVYDRISQNGRCHLFVHYKIYFQEGTEYLTQIIDMYAVDMESGAVYASGRHAWEDVGNEAYREATGEP